MEEKTGEIFFPNEKCKIFHQTTVTLDCGLPLM